MQIVFGEDQVLRGWLPEEDFSAELDGLEYLQITAGGTSTSTVKDINYDVATPESGYQYKDVVADNPTLNPSLEFYSLTPLVCSVNSATGEVTPLADGECTIRATGQTGSREFTQTISIVGDPTVYMKNSYVNGSLRDYLYDQQIAALTGITHGFASQQAGAYGNGIAAGLASTVQLSGSYGGVNTSNFMRSSRAGYTAPPLDAFDEILDSSVGSAGWRAWVTPHHYLTWRGHGNTHNGSDYKTISGEIVVEYSATEWTGSLCKLLPANYRDYLPTTLMLNNVDVYIPCWARLYNTYDGLYDVNATRRCVQPGNWFWRQDEDSRKAYQYLHPGNNALVTGGDSGSPVFCVIEGDLVILGHVAYEGQFGSFFYAAYITEIAQHISDLNASGSYSPEYVDLSGFTDYS